MAARDPHFRVYRPRRRPLPEDLRPAAGVALGVTLGALIWALACWGVYAWALFGGRP